MAVCTWQDVLVDTTHASGHLPGLCECWLQKNQSGFSDMGRMVKATVSFTCNVQTCVGTPVMACRGSGQYSKAAVLTVARQKAVPIPIRKPSEAPIPPPVWSQRASATRPTQDRYVCGTAFNQETGTWPRVVCCLVLRGVQTLPKVTLPCSSSFVVNAAARWSRRSECTIEVQAGSVAVHVSSPSRCAGSN